MHLNIPPILAMSVLCLSGGCLPVAYVYPDVDVFSADLGSLDLATPAGHESFVVEQTSTFSTTSPVLNCHDEQHIRLLKINGERVRHWSCGMEAACEILCPTTFGKRQQYKSQLKAYRRGYHSVTLLPWKPAEQINWAPADTIEQKETAIDTVSVFWKELTFPVPAPSAKEEYLRSQTLRLFVDADTSCMLATEYDWLASVAKSTETGQRHSPTYERLCAKANFWRNHEANAPILRTRQQEPPSILQNPDAGRTAGPSHRAFILAD